MKNINECEIELEKLYTQSKQLNGLINIYNESDFLKRYRELINEERLNRLKINDLEKILKSKEYLSCSHIWLDKKCIKCGLDTKTYVNGDLFGTDLLTQEECIMYETLKSNSNIINSGINLDIDHKYEIVYQISKRILSSYREIDDELLIIYIKSSLRKIYNNKISDERIYSREKRLGLKREALLK